MVVIYMVYDVFAMIPSQMYEGFRFEGTYIVLFFSESHDIDSDANENVQMLTCCLL
jgi:hypothetical protein